MNFKWNHTFQIIVYYYVWLSFSYIKTWMTNLQPSWTIAKGYMKNEICQKVSIFHHIIIHNIYLEILHWKINNDSIVDDQIRSCDFLKDFFFQCHVYCSWLPLIGLSFRSWSKNRRVLHYIPNNFIRSSKCINAFKQCQACKDHFSHKANLQF
jgi:hypothetical protein